MINNNAMFIKEFEEGLCDYTGFKYCVCVDSCSNALFIALKGFSIITEMPCTFDIIIPKHTYLSVPLSIKYAGYTPVFEDIEWVDYYSLHIDCFDINIIDSAVFIERDMVNKFKRTDIVCVSFQTKKPLSIGKGGAILFNDIKYLDLFRRLSFDGRDYMKDLKDDDITIKGYHMNMIPDDAAKGLLKLNLLPDKMNKKYSWRDYINLSKLKVFSR